MTGENGGLTLAFLLIAVLYATIGQAGASGYLAVMGVVGFAPETMKTTALALNVVVAAIATYRFSRLRLLSWRTFYPFGVLGIPFSFLGGAVQLPEAIYDPAVGMILLISAAQMFLAARGRRDTVAQPPPAPPILPALAAGAVVGFVSGTTGTGGGVFLAPLILSMNWVAVRQTAAITAAYNLLNSAAALAGAHDHLGALPEMLPAWMAVVAVGGWLGASLGARLLPETAMRYVLAFVLFGAGIRLLLT